LLESLALGPRQRVVLMRCGQERFLVGLGSDGVRTIVAVRARPGVAMVDRAGEAKWL
jgi:flagellar biogenesis protein FliO